MQLSTTLNTTPVNGSTDNGSASKVSASDEGKDVKKSEVKDVFLKLTEEQKKCPIVQALQDIAKQNKKFTKTEIDARLEQVLKDAEKAEQKVNLETSIDLLAWLSPHDDSESRLDDNNRYALEFLLIKLVVRAYKQPEILHSEFATNPKSAVLHCLQKGYFYPYKPSKTIFSIAAHEGLYEFLMVVMVGTEAGDYLRGFRLNDHRHTGSNGFHVNDGHGFSPITYTLLGFKNDKLNLDQVKSLLKLYKKFGLDRYYFQGRDLITAISTKNVALVNFLIEFYEYKSKLQEVPEDKSRLPIVDALSQANACNPPDYTMVDCLLANGASLNESSGFPSYITYSRLLQQFVDVGNIEIVKGLIHRGAACAFESKEYSVLSKQGKALQGKDLTADQQRTTLYLETVRAWQTGDGHGQKLCELNVKLPPEDQNSLTAYLILKSHQSSTSATLVGAPSQTSGKQEIKNVENIAPPVNENPLMKAIEEIEQGEQKLAPLEIHNKLELAYQAMLTAGIFKLKPAIKDASKLNYTSESGIFTEKKKEILRYLLTKFITRRFDKDIYSFLCKKNISRRETLFHVVIREGLYDVVSLVLGHKYGFGQSKFDLLYMKESKYFSSITYALVAFKKKQFSIEQITQIFLWFRKAEVTAQDLGLVIETKDLVLLKSFLEIFRLNLEELNQHNTTPLEQAVTQAQVSEDWKLVQCLLEKGALLNQDVSALSKVKHCPLLKKMTSLGRIDAVKFLLVQKAECAFNTKYSVLNVEEKDVSDYDRRDKIRRVKNYLAAVDHLRNFAYEQAKKLCEAMGEDDRNDLMLLFQNSTVTATMFSSNNNASLSASVSQNSGSNLTGMSGPTLQTPSAPAKHDQESENKIPEVKADQKISQQDSFSRAEGQQNNASMPSKPHLPLTNQNSITVTNELKDVKSVPTTTAKTSQLVSESTREGEPGEEGHPTADKNLTTCNASNVPKTNQVTLNPNQQMTCDTTHSETKEIKARDVNSNAVEGQMMQNMVVQQTLSHYGAFFPPAQKQLSPIEVCKLVVENTKGSWGAHDLLRQQFRLLALQGFYDIMNPQEESNLGMNGSSEGAVNNACTNTMK